MLSSFTIQDFKSYRKATLDLAPLTVLIGANASGKSNAIEALRLFSWIALQALEQWDMYCRKRRGRFAAP